MSCGINPKTGRRYCDERREALAKAAKERDAKGVLEHATKGAAELASNTVRHFLAKAVDKKES